MSTKGKTVTKVTKLGNSESANPINGKSKEVKDAVKSMPSIVVKSASERLEKLESLNSLRDKHRTVKETHNKILNFKASTQKDHFKLTLENETGEKFTTSNPHVNAEITQLIEGKVNELLKLAESEILDFDI